MTYFLIDFDSTLVSVESLGELARIALLDDVEKEDEVARIEKITERGMNGEISFPDSLKERLALLSLNTHHLDSTVEFLKQRVSPSALKNKEWFAAHASSIHIISGGFKELIFPIADLLGIDRSHVHANTFVVGADGTITGCDPENPLAQEKGKEQQARALGLTGDILIVGDGITDYEMKAAYPNAKFFYFAECVKREKVMALADSILDNFDVLCSTAI